MAKRSIIIIWNDQQMRMNSNDGMVVFGFGRSHAPREPIMRDKNVFIIGYYEKRLNSEVVWMNGSGMLVCENVFRNWVGWNERDMSIYRILSSIQREYHDIFSGEDWTPLSQESEIPEVFISLWEKDGIQLWTVINRNRVPVDGTIMQSKFDRNKNNYNLAAGREINVEVRD